MIITSYYQKAKVGDLSISVGNFRYARFPMDKIVELTPLSVIGKDWARLSDELLDDFVPVKIGENIKGNISKEALDCFKKRFKKLENFEAFLLGGENG